MNSMSKGHYQDDKDCSCKKPKEEGTKVLLKCKTANSVTVPVISGTTTTAAGAIVTTPLAKITLNSEGFKDPCIKFEFSTNLTPTLVTATVALSFQLFRLCKHQTVPDTIGNPWVYTPTTAVTDIITFTVCDCDCDNDCDCDDDDCCSYYVAAIASATSTGGGTASTSTLLFNNSTLSAIVVDK